MEIKIKGRSSVEYEMTEGMKTLVALFPDAEWEFDPYSSVHGELRGTILTDKDSSLTVRVEMNGLEHLGKNVRVWMFTSSTTPIACPERVTDIVAYLLRMAAQINSDLKMLPDVDYWLDGRR